ncbi:MAG: DUF456 domain-containing protein [Micrococcales bacterium]|nr:DUF456 domain-containing protein [Micrococcales bacterium]
MADLAGLAPLGLLTADPNMGIAPDGAHIWIPAVLIVIGIAGIVVPVLPGFLLALAGVGVWAWTEGTTRGWVVFGVCAAIYLVSVTLQYLVPGRRLRAAGVRTTTLLLAVALAIVGFFVVPVIGGPLGFVLGIYLVEHARARDRAQAWTQTKHALKAVLTSIGIELIGALLIATLWVVAVLTG